MIVVALNYTCCTNPNVLAVFFLSSFLSFSFLIFILSSYLHSVILWFHWQALRFVSEASGGNYIWICCCCCYWSCFGAKRHGTLACVSALVMYNLNVSITALLPSPLTPHNPRHPPWTSARHTQRNRNERGGNRWRKKKHSILSDNCEEIHTHTRHFSSAAYTYMHLKCQHSHFPTVKYLKHRCMYWHILLNACYTCTTWEKCSVSLFI